MNSAIFDPVLQKLDARRAAPGNKTRADKKAAPKGGFTASSHEIA
jgi:hypothetical protein